jgi:hypothetical protein
MHKSRLGTIVIDCRTDDIDAAARFWSEALGRRAETLADPGDSAYRELEGPPDEVKVLVQAVEHPSRVHLDIETDDIEAEVQRLEGARREARRAGQAVVGDGSADRTALLRRAAAAGRLRGARQRVGRSRRQLAARGTFSPRDAE